PVLDSDASEFQTGRDPKHSTNERCLWRAERRSETRVLREHDTRIERIEDVELSLGLQPPELERPPQSEIELVPSIVELRVRRIQRNRDRLGPLPVRKQVCRHHVRDIE